MAISKKPKVYDSEEVSAYHAITDITDMTCQSKVNDFWCHDKLETFYAHMDELELYERDKHGTCHQAWAHLQGAALAYAKRTQIQLHI